MPNIIDLELIRKTAPGDLMEMAAMVRQIAELIEQGQVRSFCYAALTGDQCTVDYVKVKGTSLFEIKGSANYLAEYISQEIDEG